MKHLLEKPSGRELFKDECLAEGQRRNLMLELRDAGVFAEITEVMGIGLPDTAYRSILVRVAQNEHLVLDIIKKHSHKRLGVHIINNYEYEIGPAVTWYCCMDSTLLNS